MVCVDEWRGGTDLEGRTRKVLSLAPAEAFQGVATIPRFCITPQPEWLEWWGSS
jgi:hypothetical protein